MLANWKKRVFPLNRRQAVFAMLLCLVLAVNAVPALRASALYLITDGEATTAVELAEPVTADKLIVVGAVDGSAELRFEGGHKVTVTHGTSCLLAYCCFYTVPVLPRREALYPLHRHRLHF